MYQSQESINLSSHPLQVNQSQSKQKVQVEPWLRAQGIDTPLDKITEVYLPKSE